MKKLSYILLIVLWVGFGACTNQSTGDLGKTSEETNAPSFTGSGQSADGTGPTMQAVDFKRYANFANIEYDAAFKKAQDLGLDRIENPQIDLSTGIAFIGYFYKTDLMVQFNAVLAQLAFYRFTLNSSGDFESGIKNLGTIIRYFQNLKRIILADSVFLGIKISDPPFNEEALSSITVTLQESLDFTFHSSELSEEQKIEFKKLMVKLASSLAYDVSGVTYYLVFNADETGLQFTLVNSANFPSFKGALDGGKIRSLYGNLREQLAEYVDQIKEGKAVYFIQYSQIEELLKYIRGSLEMEATPGENAATLRSTQGNNQELEDRALKLKAKIEELKKELEEMTAAGASEEQIKAVNTELESTIDELNKIEAELRNGSQAQAPAAAYEPTTEESLEIIQKKIEEIEIRLKKLDEQGQSDSEEAKTLEKKLDQLNQEMAKLKS